MQRVKDLFWGLAEFRNLGFEGQFLHGVLENLNVNLALVSNWVEHVVVIDRALLDAKDQVNPLMQVGRHIIRLESFSLLLQKFLGSASPSR